MIPNKPVSVKQPIHQPLHNRGIGLREGLVDDENIGNDEKVAVGDKQAGLSVALFDHLAGFRCPGHAETPNAAASE